MYEIKSRGVRKIVRGYYSTCSASDVCVNQHTTVSEYRFKKIIIITRDMQGIVGQASDFMEVVSKIDWTLLHEIWWRKIEKIKGDWRATLWYVFFLHEHISPRTSSTVVRVQVGGARCLWGTHVGGRARTRYRVGPGLRLPMRKKENVQERLKQLYSRSQLAPS